MITVNNLVVNFKENNVLNKVNMNIKKGELVLLIGDNGTGKSTLLKTIAGRVKKESGTILINNEFIYHQQNFPLLQNMTLNENIAVLKVALKLTFSTSSFNNLVEKLGLKEHMNKTIEVLSGGQKQRFSILITMLRETEVYLIDEADAAMDPKGRTLYYKLLLELNKQGKTILMISHHIKESFEISDKCYLLNNGKTKLINKSSVHDEFYRYSNDKFIKALEAL